MIDEDRFETAAATRKKSDCCRGLILALLMGFHGEFALAGAGLPVQGPQTPAAGPAPKTYTLGITREETTSVSLTADKTKVSEIAADLASRLKAVVIVAPSMTAETVSVKFSELPLESALGLLAPRVLIDYEIRQGGPPAPQGIYLLGYTDPDPVASAVVRAKSQGIYISGNTEDTGKPSPDAPLYVLYENSRLTIVAKRQSLAVVVMAVADALGVPAEIKYDAAELVDFDIKEALLPEEAVVGLSPNVRLYVRVNPIQGERTPLQLSLVK